MPSNTIVYQAFTDTIGRRDTMYRKAIANGRTNGLARNIRSAAFDLVRTSSTGQQRRQGARGVPPVRDRVLLVLGHLRERPGLTVRHEDRVEAEATCALGRLRDRPFALSPDEVVLPAAPEPEHGLEPRGPVLAAEEEAQDAVGPDCLECVRGEDAREPVERLDEHAAVIDDDVVERLPEHVERVADDDLERVSLHFRVFPVQPLAREPPALEDVRQLTELALVRRDETHHVYRPRPSISCILAIDSSALGWAARYAARTSWNMSRTS